MNSKHTENLRMWIVVFRAKIIKAMQRSVAKKSTDKLKSIPKKYIVSPKESTHKTLPSSFIYTPQWFTFIDSTATCKMTYKMTKS